MPFFSIITIARNKEDTISETMDGVARQTFQDLEHVVVDGASTDRTIEMARLAARSDVRIHSEPDSGIAEAMNKGLRMVSGEIVLFLNAGDLIEDETVLERVWSSYRAEGWSWAVGSAYEIDQHSRRPLRLVKIHAFDHDVLLWRGGLPHQSVYARRTLFDEVGGFDETFRTVVDYDWFLRAAKAHTPAILPFIASRIESGGLSYRPLGSWIDHCRARYKNQGGARISDIAFDAFRFVNKVVSDTSARVAPPALLRAARGVKHRLLPGTRVIVAKKDAAIETIDLS